MGWGDCTKEVFEDPVKPLEDAARYAWDSTAEVIGAVTDTVASDLRQVRKCDAGLTPDGPARAFRLVPLSLWRTVLCSCLA